MCSSFVSQTCSFLCHRQFRECLVRISGYVKTNDSRSDSQLYCSHLLLRIQGTAVEDPEQSLFVEALYLGVYRLHICHAVALGQSKLVKVHCRLWRSVVK